MKESYDDSRYQRTDQPHERYVYPHQGYYGQDRTSGQVSSPGPSSTPAGAGGNRSADEPASPPAGQPVNPDNGPAGSWTYQGSNSAPDQLPPRRFHKVLALIAIFLAAAILFSAATAAIVYTVLRPATDQGEVTIHSGQTTRPDTPSSSAPAEPGQPGKDLTDKHFSIADAATRPDGSKPALSIIQIAAQGKPAVVAITTETTVTDPFGQTGFGSAAGSGFILTANGYIVTNFHVIEDAQTIAVTLDNGDIYNASVVGTDSQNDLAVLKINASQLPTVVLGDSASLEVGELAVAIGNPLGQLSGTVTAGIISALDREITIDNQTLKLLQTDAAINAGNSGGALFNSFGEVIGINTAKNTGTGVEGLGFAIPIDYAKPIIESLIQNGYVKGRPRIGIYTRDLTAQLAEFYDLQAGVYVSQVTPGSAAERAGIREGDIIIAANGQPALTTEAINTIKNSLKPGDTIRLTIIRDKQQQEVAVVLDEDTPDTRP